MRKRVFSLIKYTLNMLFLFSASLLFTKHIDWLITDSHTFICFILLGAFLSSVLFSQTQIFRLITLRSKIISLVCFVLLTIIVLFAFYMPLSTVEYYYAAISLAFFFGLICSTYFLISLIIDSSLLEMSRTESCALMLPTPLLGFLLHILSLQIVAICFIVIAFALLIFTLLTPLKTIDTNNDDLYDLKDSGDTELHNTRQHKRRLYHTVRPLFALASLYAMAGYAFSDSISQKMSFDMNWTYLLIALLLAVAVILILAIINKPLDYYLIYRWLFIATLILLSSLFFIYDSVATALTCTAMAFFAIFYFMYINPLFELDEFLHLKLCMLPRYIATCIGVFFISFIGQLLIDSFAQNISVEYVIILIGTVALLFMAPKKLNRIEVKVSAKDDFNNTINKISEMYSLTHRETEVLGFLVRGWAATSIADELCISANTTRSHIRNIYTKTAAPGKQELINMYDAIRNDWKSERGFFHH